MRGKTLIVVAAAAAVAIPALAQDPQPAPDGRLADAHQPDQHDRSVEGGPVGRGPVGAGVGALFHGTGLYIRGAGRAKADPAFVHGVLMRGMTVLIVLLVVLVGGAILLSRSVSEQPVKTIEVEVAPAPGAAK